MLILYVETNQSNIVRSAMAETFSILKIRYQLQVMYLYNKRVDMMQKLIMRIYSFSCDLECRVSSCLTDTQSWTRTRSRIYVSSVECTIGMLLNGAKDSPSHIRMHLCRVFINLVYYENKGIYIYNNLILVYFVYKFYR